MASGRARFQSPCSEGPSGKKILPGGQGEPARRFSLVRPLWT